MKDKNEAISEADIRRKVNKKYDERSGLMQHAISYVMTNVVLWAIWLLTGAPFPWPLFVTFFWGIGMLSHYVNYDSKYGRGARKREAEIEAEVERELQWARAQAAARRHDHDDEEALEGATVYELDNYQRRGLRLSDDGELVDLVTEEDERLQKEMREGNET